jgi:hypothetical protein
MIKLLKPNTLNHKRLLENMHLNYQVLFFNIKMYNLVVIKVPYKLQKNLFI